MVSRFEREQLRIDEVDRFLDNQTLRNQCNSPVCATLKVQNVCQTPSERDCLVPYGYGMTLAETYKVAQQAKFDTRMAAQAEYRTSDAFDEAVPEKEVLPPFKPDWRFWSGVTLAGVGLFLHRSR